jgi:hypothetical protein
MQWLFSVVLSMQRLFSVSMLFPAALDEPLPERELWLADVFGLLAIGLGTSDDALEIDALFEVLGKDQVTEFVAAASGDFGH